MRRLASFLVGLTIGVAGCGSSRESTSAGDVGSSSDRDLARAIAQSDVLKDAQSRIDRGHPWRATLLLAPILRDPQKRTPAALIVAARAAAGWGGSADVDKLLASESWIDSEFGGEARELLTRAALERGADTTALTHASAAMRDAREPDTRATRLVLLARALERNNFFDSAAANYSRAAGTFPSIHDWLQLRVAGTERDSAKRAAVYATVTLPVARPRIAWTEAQPRSTDTRRAALERYAQMLGGTKTDLARFMQEGQSAIRELAAGLQVRKHFAQFQALLAAPDDSAEGRLRAQVALVALHLAAFGPLSPAAGCGGDGAAAPVERTDLRAAGLRVANDVLAGAAL